MTVPNSSKLVLEKSLATQCHSSWTQCIPSFNNFSTRLKFELLGGNFLWKVWSSLMGHGWKKPNLWSSMRCNVTFNDGSLMEFLQETRKFGSIWIQLGTHAWYSIHDWCYQLFWKGHEVHWEQLKVLDLVSNTILKVLIEIRILISSLLHWNG